MAYKLKARLRRAMPGVHVDELLVKGGYLLDLERDPDRPPLCDVRIVDGRIAEIGADLRLAQGARTLDATGTLIVPGFVNAHCHTHDLLLKGRFEQLPLEIWGLLTQPGGFPARDTAEIDLRTKLGAAECLRSGITCVQDMVTLAGAEPSHMDAVANAYGQAGIRAVVAFQIADRGLAETVPFADETLSAPVRDKLPGPRDPSRLIDEVENRLAAGGGGLVGWALGPSAPQRCSPALLARLRAIAVKYDARVFTHLLETRSQAVLARTAYGAQGGSLVRLLAETGFLGPNLACAHGVWFADAEIDEFGAAGASLVFNPVSNLKLLNGVARVRRFADAGANLALGCDNCSASDSQNMFNAMKTFALHWGLQSGAGETGAARAAFHAATLGGAKALGLEGRVGAVRAGMRADFSLIDLADPVWQPMNSALRQLVYGESGRGVRDVLVDGRVVVRDRRLATLDEKDLAARAAAARAALDAACGKIDAHVASMREELLALHRRAAQYPLDFDRLRF